MGELFYTGKQWDEDVELYYFNARWYDPETGRFITEDPIRDGLLWFAYVNNNPMGFVDPTGNYLIPSVEYHMQNPDWARNTNNKRVRLANSTYYKDDSRNWYMDTHGCRMTHQAGTVAALSDKSVTPKEINDPKYSDSSRFYSSKVNKDYGLKERSFSNGDLTTQIQDAIDNQYEGFVIRAHVSTGKNGMHRVGVKNLVSLDGLKGQYIEIIPTSDWDDHQNSEGTLSSRNWIIKDGKVYIKTTDIQDVELLNSPELDKKRAQLHSQARNTATSISQNNNSGQSGSNSQKTHSGGRTLRDLFRSLFNHNKGKE